MESANNQKQMEKKNRNRTTDNQRSVFSQRLSAVLKCQNEDHQIFEEYNRLSKQQMKKAWEMLE